MRQNFQDLQDLQDVVNIQLQCVKTSKTFKTFKTQDAVKTFKPSRHLKISSPRRLCARPTRFKTPSRSKASQDLGGQRRPQFRTRPRWDTVQRQDRPRVQDPQVTQDVASSSNHFSLGAQDLGGSPLKRAQAPRVTSRLQAQDPQHQEKQDASKPQMQARYVKERQGDLRGSLLKIKTKTQDSRPRACLKSQDRWGNLRWAAKDLEGIPLKTDLLGDPASRASRCARPLGDPSLGG
ncbi:hypothetical protein B0H17DRAFT_1276424 [Mycena rosella]|uniref:Uncharacterized protein n=1 Tax=Mycena rosella TaxID=1033263 RepID=A0AAD7GGR7_MYCRO|nr:hypothetical protein B0H17DRAFT_1276424 [Mycena rosella]